MWRKGRNSRTCYWQRYNNVAKTIHQKLTHEHQLIKEKVPTFKFEPDTVLENTRCRIMGDRSVITAKTIPANRPDIIAPDRVNKCTYLIDIAVPGTINLEKINKYIEMADEIRIICNQEEVKIIPILVTATGIVPKNMFNSLKEIGLSQCIYRTTKASYVRDLSYCSEIYVPVIRKTTLSRCLAVAHVLNFKTR
jgi:hypothetical protein